MSSNKAYEKEVLKFRTDRETRLRENERSWLALSGLFWLEEGNNTFGSDSSNNIQLENASIPAFAGVFQYKNNVVTLKVNEGAAITCNGVDVKSKTLHADVDENPDFLELGSMIIVVIRRGKNCLIRVWDRENPDRKNFMGLKHYPVNAEYRITANFVPYEPPRLLKIRDVIGEEYDVEFPGFAVFTLGGKECRLEAEKTTDGLFFNFYDPTNGNGSYPGGRFLTADAPTDREVVLDFNMAYNPPCAYTDYATCPLPPSQNRLPVRIPAGEMIYRHHHE
ncbi:MAG: DUF1684 domain-containing protein [Anaerolineaceae bacterium]|nr:MAG: DUF1684 domain-containing protein [Anaerolineaceae bacterium]